MTNRRDRRAAGFRVSEEFRLGHPDADPTATELVVNLLETATLVQARLDQLLRRWGLATGSFNVLSIVVGADGPLSPTEIAGRVRVPVTTATVTGLLDTLERKGWVARGPHPEDRRRVLVAATAEGRALLAEVVPAVTEQEQRWTGGLGRARRVALADELGALQTHLRSLDP